MIFVAVFSTLGILVGKINGREMKYLYGLGVALFSDFIPTTTTISLDMQAIRHCCVNIVGRPIAIGPSRPAIIWNSTISTALSVVETR